LERSLGERPQLSPSTDPHLTDLYTGNRLEVPSTSTAGQARRGGTLGEHDDVAVTSRRRPHEELANGTSEERSREGAMAGTTIEFPEPLTPRATRILENAAWEAQRVGARGFIGAEHIFLAILDDPDAVPSKILERLDVRQQILQALVSFLESDAYG
jgi:ATP-dependent Clp protease ATP-binding subunit ClpA